MIVQDISIGRFGETNYWRATALPPRLFFFDYRASFAVLPMIFYFRLPVLIIGTTFIIVLAVFERRMISPENIVRYVKTTFAGRDVWPSRGSPSRMPVDYGFETITPDRSLISWLDRRISRGSDFEAERPKERSGWVAALASVPVIGKLF